MHEIDTKPSSAAVIALENENPNNGGAESPAASPRIMRFSFLAVVVAFASEAVVAAPMRAEALPLTLLPREMGDYQRRNQPSAQQLAANGRSCGIGSKQGVCDNGRCGTFVAPTGFTLIRGTEAQCGGATRER